MTKFRSAAKRPFFYFTRCHRRFRHLLYGGPFGCPSLRLINNSYVGQWGKHVAAVSAPAVSVLATPTVLRSTPGRWRILAAQARIYGACHDLGFVDWAALLKQEPTKSTQGVATRHSPALPAHIVPKALQPPTKRYAIIQAHITDWGGHIIYIFRREWPNPSAY